MVKVIGDRKKPNTFYRTAEKTQEGAQSTGRKVPYRAGVGNWRGLVRRGWRFPPVVWRETSRSVGKLGGQTASREMIATSSLFFCSQNIRQGHFQT